MELGRKIYELRKTANLSQEQLSEKLNITRQTISNWELGQTTPDIYQAKEISKIFNISLDELADNDIKDILVEKIIKTEKIANKTIKTFKFLLIIFICILIFISIVNICFVYSNYQNTKNEEQKYQEFEQQYKQYRSSLKKKKFLGSINKQVYEFVIFYDNEMKIDSWFFNSMNGYEGINEDFEYLSEKISIIGNIGMDERKIIEEVKRIFEDKGGKLEEVL